MTSNDYQILELPFHAPWAEVQAQYTMLSNRYHPDNCQDENSSEKFFEIKRAYETIQNRLQSPNSNIWFLKQSFQHQQEKMREAQRKLRSEMHILQRNEPSNPNTRQKENSEANENQRRLEEIRRFSNLNIFARKYFHPESIHHKYVQFWKRHHSTDIRTSAISMQLLSLVDHNPVLDTLCKEYFNKFQADLDYLLTGVKNGSYINCCKFDYSEETCSNDALYCNKRSVLRRTLRNALWDTEISKLIEDLKGIIFRYQYKHALELEEIERKKLAQEWKACQGRRR